jgi:hypothetical protein
MIMRRYLQSRAKSGGKSMSAKVADAIQAKAGPIPHDIQRPNCHPSWDDSRVLVLTCETIVDTKTRNRGILVGWVVPLPAVIRRWILVRPVAPP